MLEEAGGMWIPSCSSSMMQEPLFPLLPEEVVVAGVPDGDEQHPLFPFPALDDLLLSINLPDAALGLDDGAFAISEYDDMVEIDGELFKVPSPLLEDSLLASDPLAFAIPLMPNDYGVAAGTDTIQHEDLMQSAAFLDCKTSSDDDDHLLLPASVPMDDQAPGFVVPPANLQTSAPAAPAAAAAAAAVEEEESLQKSVSFGCLTSATEVDEMDVQEAAFGTNSMMTMRTYSEGDIQLFDVPEMSLEAAAFAMRTYSDGDVQGIGVNTNFGHGDRTNTVTCFELLSALEDVKLEERSRKLSRYRKKRTQRNFGRKIKYACRKALADSQPRVRGRFAKMKGTHDDPRQN